MPGKTPLAISVPSVSQTARYAPQADAALALADGRVFRGRGFGARVDAQGEVVFTTTMVGYQEVTTDPSFRGQLVCMTYPLIGNYGIHLEANESRQPWIAGLIVREHSERPSHNGSTGTLHEYLERHGIPAIAGIDTRALTLHIREVGDTRGIIVQVASGMPDTDLVARARHSPLPGEYDVVGEVTAPFPETIDGPGPHIVVLDCGVKRNIVRSLAKRGARLTIVPFGTSLEEIIELQPDGVVVSPGPGDPANLDAGLSVVAGVVKQQIPYFGICFGNQLFGRALGFGTFKLGYGHRGINQPVMDLTTRKVEVTAHNHGFAVAAAPGERYQTTYGTAEVSHICLNDDVVEGLQLTGPAGELLAFSVQYHPEAAAGPHDASYLFDRFVALMASQGGAV